MPPIPDIIDRRWDRLGGQSLRDYIGVARLKALSAGILGMIIIITMRRKMVMVVKVVATTAAAVTVMAAVISPDQFFLFDALFSFSLLICCHLRLSTIFLLYCSNLFTCYVFKRRRRASWLESFITILLSILSQIRALMGGGHQWIILGHGVGWLVGWQFWFRSIAFCSERHLCSCERM